MYPAESSAAHHSMPFCLQFQKSAYFCKTPEPILGLMDYISHLRRRFPLSRQDIDVYEHRPYSFPKHFATKLNLRSKCMSILILNCTSFSHDSMIRAGYDIERIWLDAMNLICFD